MEERRAERCAFVSEENALCVFSTQNSLSDDSLSPVSAISVSIERYIVDACVVKMHKISLCKLFPCK